MLFHHHDKREIEQQCHRFNVRSKKNVLFIEEKSFSSSLFFPSLIYTSTTHEIRSIRGEKHIIQEETNGISQEEKELLTE